MKNQTAKKRLLQLIFVIISAAFLNVTVAQVPQGFNYQAIARGSDGKEKMEICV